jgi:hypothetical protein
MINRLPHCLVLLILILSTAEAQKKAPTDALAAAAAKGDSKALQKLQNLSEQGTASAQFQLGLMYATGKGVPKDGVLAERWYRKAAEQDDANAQNKLGAMYETGSVVSKDLVVAYMWYNLAAARGDPKFRSNRDQLEKQMTPQQVADAQKLSREWTHK